MSLPARLAALLLVLCAIGPAMAQVKVEGQTFAALAQVGNAELRLNGVGLRAVAWLKGYVAGLYLPKKVTTAAEVLQMPGPKRLQLRMLQEVSTHEFIKAFDKGIKRNTPEADLPAVAERMARFDAMLTTMGKVRKGDVVDLDFVPASGLTLSWNGKIQGEPIPGADLYTALLKIFIGDKPTDPELKTGLLGGPVQ
jgi:hypothetical protein